MKFRIHDDANADIETARQYYRDTKFLTLRPKIKIDAKSNENELSLAFYNEIKRVVYLIGKAPFMATEVEPGYFRRHLKRFPYKILYFADDSEILILAVSHNHMHPDGWKLRI
jgi:plasmid stabilization system protein ParE